MEQENLSISSFKRFAIRFLLPFIVGAIIFCVLYDYVLSEKIIFKSPTSGAAKIHRLLHESYNDEIAILGSSRTVGSYVPELISEHCYNYGIEGTEIDMINLMLKKELSKNKSTPVIINFDYEFYQEKFGDITHFIANVKDQEVRNYIGDKYSYLYSINGIRYFGAFDHYLKEYLADHTTKNYASKGGFFLNDKFSQSEFEKLKIKRAGIPHQWEIDSVKADRFRSLILSNPQRKIYIIAAPYHATYMSTFTNLQEADAYLESLKKISNVVLINKAAVTYPDSLFLNTTHLNLAGAKRFSSEIRSELMAIDSSFKD